MHGILNKKIAVLCETRDQAEAFVRRCHQYGIGWIDGHNVAKTHFDTEQKMAYDLNEGHISWANLEYYQENGWETIEFKEFMKRTLIFWLVPDVDFDVD